MDLAKNIVLHDSETCSLKGRNIGAYPIHRFTHFPGLQEERGWPLKLASFGHCEWIAGCLRVRRNSPLFSIELVEEGTFKFKQDGASYQIGHGGVFLVAQGKDSEMAVDEGRAVKSTLVITGDSLRGILASAGLEGVDVVRPHSLATIKRLFEEARECLADTSPESMRRGAALAFETILALGAEARTEELHPAVKEALDMMGARIRGKLSMRELCARCSCSAMTLHRLFKKRFGKSPIEYFIDSKMEMAKESLSGSAPSVKELALQLGYSSQLYFSSEFRKRVGMPPSAYRKRAGTPLI